MNPFDPNDSDHINPDPHKQAHPDMRSDAPGRIPESLIDAAIDGELNLDMQREIAHALQYDPTRKQELVETADAINALQMPIPMPDFADGVLDRADHHRRFIPAAWRSHVRTGRLGIAAALLVTLMTVAGLQHMYPRLTTLAAHPTPVLDIEEAFGHDADQLAECVTDEVRTLRASLLPINSFPITGRVPVPGKTDHHFELVSSTPRLSRSPSGTYPAHSPSGTYPAHSPSGTYPAQMRLVSFNHGTASVYFLTERNLGVSNTQCPLQLVGTGSMGNWSMHSANQTTGFPSTQARLVRESNAKTEPAHLDIPALP